jgi:hypothetical protein
MTRRNVKGGLEMRYCPQFPNKRSHAVWEILCSGSMVETIRF